jgi:hypothetical protein
MRTKENSHIVKAMQYFATTVHTQKNLFPSTRTLLLKDKEFRIMKTIII